MQTRRFVVALVALLVAAPALAIETPEFTVGAGYHMLGQTDASYDFPVGGYQTGTLNIRDSVAYTGALAIPLKAQSGARFEARYTYQPTRVQFETTQDTDLFDMDVHTLVGGFFMDKVGAGSTVVPYGGISLGATMYDPDADYSSETLFTLTATAGVTKYTSEKMGLTMRADLIMPIDWNGGTVWVGTGGSGVGLGGTSYFTQIALSAGLTFRLGGK
jgi:hypothetical protein